MLKYVDRSILLKFRKICPNMLNQTTGNSHTTFSLYIRQYEVEELCLAKILRIQKYLVNQWIYVYIWWYHYTKNDLCQTCDRVKFLFRVELCAFSGLKIYPGHGKRAVKADGRVSGLFSSYCPYFVLHSYIISLEESLASRVIQLNVSRLQVLEPR